MHLALSLPSCQQVKHIAAGGMHSVAVSMDGDVYTTGVNDEGALGRKTGEQAQRRDVAFALSCAPHLFAEVLHPAGIAEVRW